MREFITAVAAVVEDEDGTHFPIKEVDAEGNVIHVQDCVAYKPAEGQVIMMMAGLGRHGTMADKVSSIINFLADTVDETTHAYLVSRLLNRNDEFGLEQVQEILEALMEEWGGRPTKLPSDFAQSQKTGGQKSTRRTRVST